MGKYVNVGNSDDSVWVDRFPTECPICHLQIIAGQQYARFGGQRFALHPDVHDCLEVVFLCPNHDCNEIFIAYFDYTSSEDGYVLMDTRPRELQKKSFSKTLLTLSKDFCEIYEEASQAEQSGLKKVCGVGYRKALEFLVKDYLIQQNPQEKEPIERQPLGACIDNRVSDPRIRDVASRAVWLGNDETHYTRKWFDKDLSDLKVLIDLTVHWIEMEIKTEELLKSMPKK